MTDNDEKDQIYHSSQQEIAIDFAVQNDSGNFDDLKRSQLEEVLRETPGIIPERIEEALDYALGTENRLQSKAKQISQSLARSSESFSDMLENIYQSLETAYKGQKEKYRVILNNLGQPVDGNNHSAELIFDPSKNKLSIKIQRYSRQLGRYLSQVVEIKKGRKGLRNRFMTFDEDSPGLGHRIYNKEKYSEEQYLTHVRSHNDILTSWQDLPEILEKHFDFKDRQYKECEF
ncbi:MAG: hypothetical protein ACLFPQ_03740 [Candidatus Woesearchaeota archaeon]